MRCLGVKGGSGENFAQSERGCDPGLANVDNVDNGGLGGGLTSLPWAQVKRVVHG